MPSSGCCLRAVKVIDRARCQRFEPGTRFVGVRDQEATRFSITDDGDPAVSDTPFDPVPGDLELPGQLGQGQPSRNMPDGSVANRAARDGTRGYGALCLRERGHSNNAPMESFFHTLKTELVHHRDYLTRDEARHDIFDFVEVFYNRQRSHSTRAIG